MNSDRYRDAHAPQPPQLMPGQGAMNKLVRWSDPQTIPDLRKALEACVEVMEKLPTLDGIAGLAVLENARDVLKRTAG